MKNPGFLMLAIVALTLAACGDNPEMDYSDINTETEVPADSDIPKGDFGEGVEPGGFQPEVNGFGEGSSIEVRGY